MGVENIAAELASELVKDVKQQILVKVASEVSDQIAKIDITEVVRALSKDLAEQFSKSIKDQILEEVVTKSRSINIDETVTATAVERTETIVTGLREQVAKQVMADMDRKLSQIDVNHEVREYVNRALSGMVHDIKFPDGSIPGQAIDLTQFKISGSNVAGGIIDHFGSTGIQDLATDCQLTVSDDATIVENTLLAANAEVKGDLKVDGNLVIMGEVPEDSPFYRDVVEHAAGKVRLSLNDDFFRQYTTQVYDRIREEGIDLTRLTINGNEIIRGNQIGYSITESNLQKVGELKSLTVNGSVDLTNSVFVRNKRLGINTAEPSAALSVWDEEVEILGRKLRKDIAAFGTTRPQALVLGSNGKENLTLLPDGSVVINRLNVGSVVLTSADAMPTHDAKPGTIVFNERPNFGQPVMWVSIGGARWAGIGIIS